MNNTNNSDNCDNINELNESGTNINNTIETFEIYSEYNNATVCKMDSMLFFGLIMITIIILYIIQFKTN
jgi:hypothetical protein